MGSSGSVPWYARQPREFPAQRWLRERYPFRVTFAPSITSRAQPEGQATAGPREFPAKRWLRERQANARL